MSFVLDVPPSRGWGERCKVNTVHFEPLLILMGANPVPRAIGKGWAMKIETFWTLKWLRAKLMYIKLTMYLFLYDAWTWWFWWGQIHHSAHWKGWALKVSTFWGPNGTRFAISGPKKVSILSVNFKNNSRKIQNMLKLSMPVEEKVRSTKIYVFGSGSGFLLILMADPVRGMRTAP